VRVGFLGAGLIAGYHTRALRASGQPVLDGPTPAPGRTGGRRRIARVLRKPLATDYARAQAMAAAVASAGVVNQVGLVLRSAPALNALAERLAA
jgi:predicted dehydrogenase